MENWVMFVDFFLVTGMAMQFLLIIFLLKARTHFSKNLLVIFFASSLFFLLYYYGYLHRSKPLGAVAVLFGNGTGYLLGPVTYLYLKALILPRKKILKALKLHLIPFVINWFLISLPVSMSMATTYLTAYGKNYAAIADYLNLIENAYFIVYMYLTYKLAKQVRNKSLENYSSLKHTDLSWFLNLLVGLLIIVMLDSSFSIYELVFPMIPWNIGTIIAFLFVILYTFLGYKGIFQSNLLLPDHIILKDEEIKPKAASSSTLVINEKEAETLEKKLYRLLDDKKLYLNESLSLTDLAEALGMTNKKLSGLLNQHLNINFYTLINNYRVAEIQKKLKENDNDKYTLLSLAYDSGFQSKATFNRIFKDKTGMSPSKYRKAFSQ